MIDLAGMVGAEMSRRGADEWIQRHAPRLSPKDGRKVRWLGPVPRLSEMFGGTTAAGQRDPGEIVERDDWYNFTLAARLGEFAEATDEELLAFARRIVGQVNVLLAAAWRAVEILAEELLIFRDVSGERVAEIVAKTPPRDLPAVLPEPAPRETERDATGGRLKIRRAVESVAALSVAAATSAPASLEG